MNYNQPGSEIRQSDEILRKLNQIKSAIQDHREPSPDNLNQYLPKERLNSNPFNQPKAESSSNPQSYRKSLEKRLQRLFKEERKVFNQNQGPQAVYEDHIKSSEPFKRFETKDAFTVERMEDKIKQLERKYLFSNGNSQQKRPKKTEKQKETDYEDMKAKKIKFQDTNEGRETPYKKTKSFYDKKSNKKERMQEKSDERLLTEISALKKQVRQIKESNVSLNEKIQHKENERKYKKERSRYLLGCILTKLIQIQDEVRRRQKRQQRKIGKEAKPMNSVQERQSLINANSALIKQVEELSKKLRVEVSERERAQQRSNWIQNQLRKLNRA